MFSCFVCRLCCISPVLAARVLPGCSVTVGSDQSEDGRWPYAGTASAIEKMGAKHVSKDVTVSFYSTRLLEYHYGTID